MGSVHARMIKIEKKIIRTVNLGVEIPRELDKIELTRFFTRQNRLKKHMVKLEPEIPEAFRGHNGNRKVLCKKALAPSHRMQVVKPALTQDILFLEVLAKPFCTEAKRFINRVEKFWQMVKFHIFLAFQKRLKPFREVRVRFRGALHKRMRILCGF